MSAKHRIGIVGAGLMGHGIAKNLVEKGFPLDGARASQPQADRRPVDAGAKEVKGNAEVAKNADIVFLCVTGAPQVEEIVFGADGIAASTQRTDRRRTSTSEPGTTAKIREALAKKGVAFVDAPLARTPSRRSRAG